jgi:hypothetical protein
MSTTITAGNATNGLALSADNTGVLELKTGTGAGTTALTLSSTQIATFAGTVAAATGTLYPLVSGTAVASTSGTSIDFTGIPSWVKRITVMLNGVSTSGTSIMQIQLGTSGGVVTTGYLTAGIGFGVSSMGTTSASSGFIFNNAAVAAAANAIQGQVIFSSFGNNTWTGNGAYTLNTSNQAGMCAGSISLGGTLDRVRITTVNGTDTFDAGSINILYE